MGHVGMTPQSVNAFGGFRVQGKSSEAAAPANAEPINPRRDIGPDALFLAI
jgi:ketopantoate hydroxymethyltransferase